MLALTLLVVSSDAVSSDAVSTNAVNSDAVSFDAVSADAVSSDAASSVAERPMWFSYLYQERLGFPFRYVFVFGTFSCSVVLADGRQRDASSDLSLISLLWGSSSLSPSLTTTF